MTKGFDLLVAALENEGVDRIFGVPGEENLDVVESLRQHVFEPWAESRACPPPPRRSTTRMYAPPLLTAEQTAPVVEFLCAQE
jgi:hypothetical protein